MKDRINERNGKNMSGLLENVQPAVKKETKRVVMITGAGLIPRLLVTCTWCLHSRLQNLHDFFLFYWSIFIFSYTDSMKNTVHITCSLAYYLI